MEMEEGPLYKNIISHIDINRGIDSIHYLNFNDIAKEPKFDEFLDDINQYNDTDRWMSYILQHRDLMLTVLEWYIAKEFRSFKIGVQYKNISKQDINLPQNKINDYFN